MNLDSKGISVVELVITEWLLCVMFSTFVKNVSFHVFIYVSFYANAVFLNEVANSALLHENSSSCVIVSK